MSFPDSLRALLQDPPPEFAFEITAEGIAMSRTRPLAPVQYAPVPKGVIVPSPVKDNIIDPILFAAAVNKLVPRANTRSRRTAALILPDNCVRISVLDFDKLPDKEDDRLSLIRFRMRKTLPFDIDEAALSYHVQTGNKVIVAVTPADLISRYEAPFRAAGLHPGFVTASSIALLELVPVVEGSVLLAHRSPGALTVLALQDGIVELSRTLELTGEHTGELNGGTSGDLDDASLEEISQDLYPTLVYVEDRTGARPARLILAGFGPESSAATRLSIDLDIPAESIAAAHPGLAGYLRSITPGARKAAA